GTIRIWDAKTGNLRLNLDAKNGVANVLAFNPAGDTLAVATGGGEITLWNMDTDAVLSNLDGFDGDADPYVGPGTQSGSCCVVWAADSSMIAVDQYNGLVPIWDTNTGRALHLIHAYPGPVSGLGLSLASKMLVASGSDNTIKVWN